MQTPADKLTSRAKNWVSAMKSQFHSTGLGTMVHPPLAESEMLYKIY